jgi:hypothetical protein
MHPYNRIFPGSTRTPNALAGGLTRTPNGLECGLTRTPNGLECGLTRPTAGPRNSGEVGPHPLKNAFAPIQPFLSLSIPGRYQPDAHFIEPQKNMVENDTQLRLRLFEQITILPAHCS